MLGVPGTGKSCYALARTLELARQPAYVLAHDPGWRLADVLPDGRKTGLIRHDTMADFHARMKLDATGVHCLATPDAGEVVQVAIKVAAASVGGELVDGQLRGGRKEGVPVVVLIDEAVSAADTSPHRLGDEMRKMIALRRHAHTGLVWTCQGAALCHYAMISLGTEVVMFRMVDEHDLDRLRQARVPEEIIARVPHLKNYEFIAHRFG